jgi:hypothetical protein
LINLSEKQMVSDHASRREILKTSLLLPLAAGGVSSVSPSAAARIQQGKTLVAYFSRSGNTRGIAGQISRALRADLFEINPAMPYPDDYFETIEQAKQESDRGYKPPLKANVADIASYVTVFLGFPIWGMTARPWSALSSPRITFRARPSSRSSRMAVTDWETARLSLPSMRLRLFLSRAFPCRHPKNGKRLRGSWSSSARLNRRNSL